MFFSSLKTWVFVTFSFRTKKTLKLHVIQSFPVKLKYKNYTIFLTKISRTLSLIFLRTLPTEETGVKICFYNDSIIYVTVIRYWMIDV
jgi:hypothetical protein